MNKESAESRNSGHCPLLPPNTIALEDTGVQRTGEQRNRNRHMLRSRQGAEGRVGLHTCTQLEGLTLAPLPHPPPTVSLRSHTQKSLLNTLTTLVPSSHQDPLGLEMGLCRAYSLGVGWGGDKNVPQESDHGVSCAQLSHRPIVYYTQPSPAFLGPPRNQQDSLKLVCLTCWATPETFNQLLFAKLNGDPRKESTLMCLPLPH